MFCFCHQVLMTVARVEILYILYTFSESRTVFSCSFWDFVLLFCFFTHIFRVYYYYCFIGNLTSYPSSSINHHRILFYSIPTTYRTFYIVYLCIFCNSFIFVLKTFCVVFIAQTVFLLI